MTHFIRRLDAADAAAFRQIRLAALQQHPEAFGAAWESEQQQSLDFFAQRLRNTAVFAGFNDNGDMQGVVGVARSEAAKIRHIASLWGVYLCPEARGCRLARALILDALHFAQTECQSVRLSVTASNTGAIRLYHSLGFKEWARDRHALNVNGTFYDEILMRLDCD